MSQQHYGIYVGYIDAFTVRMKFADSYSCKNKPLVFNLYGSMEGDYLPGEETRVRSWS